MKGRQAREMKSLALCQRFLDDHADVAASVGASRIKLKLDAAVRDADVAAKQQEFARRQRRAEAAATRVAKHKLRQAMQPVAEVAKSTYQDAPDMMGLFMPPTSIATASLVANALALADGAEAISHTLLDAGLPPGFADAIRSRATVVTEAMRRVQEMTVARTGATRGIMRAIKRGRSAIAILDALLAPALEQSPDLRAAWKHAKRIPDKPGPAPM
jgi:hypothetical protein